MKSTKTNRQFFTDYFCEMIGICCLCVILILCLICVFAIKHLIQSLKSHPEESEKKPSENVPLNDVDSSQEIPQRKMYGGTEKNIKVTIEKPIVSKYSEKLAKIAYAILKENGGKYNIPNNVKDGTVKSFTIKPFYNNITLDDLLDISENASDGVDKNHTIKFSDIFTKDAITAIIGNSEIKVNDNIKEFEDKYKEKFEEFEKKYNELLKDGEEEDEIKTSSVKIPEAKPEEEEEKTEEEEEKTEKDTSKETPKKTHIRESDTDVEEVELGGYWRMTGGVKCDLKKEIKETIEIAILRMFVEYITSTGTDEEKLNKMIDEYLNDVKTCVNNINEYTNIDKSEIIKNVDKTLQQVFSEESNADRFVELMKDNREHIYKLIDGTYKHKVFYSYMNLGEYNEKRSEKTLNMLYNDEHKFNTQLTALINLLKLLYKTTFNKYIPNDIIKKLFNRCGIEFSEGDFKIVDLEDSSKDSSPLFNKLIGDIPVTVNNIEFLKDIKDITYETQKGYNVSLDNVKDGDTLYLVIDSYNASANSITYKYSTDDSLGGIEVDSISFHKDIRNNPFFSAIFMKHSLDAFNIKYETKTIEMSKNKSENIGELNYTTLENILTYKKLDPMLKTSVEKTMNDFDKEFNKIESEQSKYVKKLTKLKDDIIEDIKKHTDYHYYEYMDTIYYDNISNEISNIDNRINDVNKYLPKKESISYTTLNGLIKTDGFTELYNNSKTLINTSIANIQDILKHFDEYVHQNELDRADRKKLEENDEEDLVISTYLLDEHEDILNKYKESTKDSQRDSQRDSQINTSQSLQSNSENGKF